MQIQMLRSFLSLADSGSISECSRKLNISQQGLSRQLKSLEAEVGVSLVNRNYQGIELTAAGKAAVPLFRRVLSTYDESLRQLASYKDEKPEKLRLFICPGIKEALGLDFFFQFQRHHPQVKLDLQFAEDTICEQALLSGDADAAFLDWPHHPEKYQRQLVVRSRLVGVMRRDDPLAKKNPLSMDQLAGVQVYFPDESNYMSQRFRQHWPKFYSAVKRTISSNDYDSFYRLPLKLGGVALTFRFLCQHLEPELIAVPIKELSFVEIFLCRRLNNPPTAGLELLTQYFKKNVHLVEKD